MEINSNWICSANTIPDSIFHDMDTGILFASFRYAGSDWEGDMERMRKASA
ncbi:unnamed protein product [Calypogeia fissa]